MTVVSAPLANSLSVWDHLWPVLLSAAFSAALSLVALTFVQLYIVPRVEGRKRREERWEHDVLSLGEFLSFEYEEAAATYRESLYRLTWIADAEQRREDYDPSRLAASRRRVEEERNEARDAYRRARSRLRWLVERVVRPSGQPAGSLLGLDLEVRSLSIKGFDMVDPTFMVDPTALTAEALKQATDEHSKTVHRLLEEVRRLTQSSLAAETPRARLKTRRIEFRAPVRLTRR